MDVSVGHLGSGSRTGPGDPGGFSPYLPGQNLAVDAARAERLAPATTPRDFKPPRDLHVYAPNPALVTPRDQPQAATAQRPSDPSPGFPRLADQDAHPASTFGSDPVVIERQVPIYPPATLGVMLDVFA